MKEDGRGKKEEISLPPIRSCVFFVFINTTHLSFLLYIPLTPTATPASNTVAHFIKTNIIFSRHNLPGFEAAKLQINNHITKESFNNVTQFK